MRREPSGNGGTRWSWTRSMPRPTTASATRSMRRAGPRRPWRTGAIASNCCPTTLLRCGALPGCWRPRRNAPTLRRAAWVLATSPDAAILNGVEALAFAVRAVEISGGNDARLLDTLAAAYAEKGQYANAALTARRARARASQEKQPALADEIAIRIALYESGQPFRDREAAADRR